MRTLTNETLDLLENRMLQSMLGEIDELPAATLEIFRKVLKDNGRLTAPMEHYVEPSEDVDSTAGVVPFPTRSKS